MPALVDAHLRHVNLYLSEAEKADGYFSTESTQADGINIFDRNREQIECAIEWITHQTATDQIDILLARFADSLSSIGMVRYSIKEKLIPLHEQKVLAAQRLGWRDLEADAFDGLGILYAFLGYLRQAIKYFEMANEIATQTKDKSLKGSIQEHVRLAQKQLGKDERQQHGRLRNSFSIMILNARLLYVRNKKNPFAEIAILNNIANIYLDSRKWDLAVRLFREANTISQKNSYRFGELQASIGLLQAEMFKDNIMNNSYASNLVSDRISDFAWSNDFLVFETLLELAPAIQNAESIAQHLRENNNLQAGGIYEQLDKIMAETNKILMAAQENSAQKDEIFVSCLGEIKNSLSIIVGIKSYNSL